MRLGVPETDGPCGFALVGEDEDDGIRPAITSTQKDVRALQLAKRAMHNGINILLEKNGLAHESVQALIAGASGTHALFRCHCLCCGNMLDRSGYNPK